VTQKVPDGLINHNLSFLTRKQIRSVVGATVDEQKSIRKKTVKKKRDLHLKDFFSQNHKRVYG
jgi:hypothetical protein